MRPAPIVLALEPAGATVSPCADLVMPNVLGLPDSSPVPLYGYDSALGEFVQIATGVVQNGGSQIFAAGALCTLTPVFPACAPATTTVVGSLARDDEPIANVPVYVRGKSGRSFHPPADLNGDGSEDNYQFPALTYGCVSSSDPLAAFGRVHRAATLLDVTPPAAVPVPGGNTVVGPGASEFATCGQAPVDTVEILAEHTVDVAVDAAGNVYVADVSRYRVLKFDPSGNLLLTWGSEGSGPGQFGFINGLAVDAADFVYVAEGDRFQKFDSSGNHIYTSGPSPIIGPKDLVVDSQGNVWLTDPGFLFKFDSAGKFVTQYPFPFGFKMAIDASDILYIARNDGGPELVKVDTSANIVAAWPLTDSCGSGVALDQAGNVYCTTTARTIEKRDPSGNLVATLGSVGSGPLQFLDANGIAVNAAGTIYAGDAGNDRVQVIGPTGNFIEEWMTVLYYTEELALDGAGNLYVLSTSPELVVKLDPTLEFVSSFPAPMLAEDMAVDTNGFVYLLIADPANPHVEKYDANGALLFQCGGQVGMGDGEFSSPLGIQVGPDGSIFVTDSTRIQTFDPVGNFLNSVPLVGGVRFRQGRTYVFTYGALSLYGPGWTLLRSVSFPTDYSVAPDVGRDGSIFKNTDPFIQPNASSHVSRLSSTGQLQRTWSTRPKIFHPEPVVRAILADDYGNLFVADDGRIQKYHCP